MEHRAKRLDPKGLHPRSTKALIALTRALPFLRRTCTCRPIRPSIGLALNPRCTTSWRSAPRAGRRPATRKPGETPAIVPSHQTLRSRKTRRRLDDIGEMRREADAYTVQAAERRQIADAAQPLYDTLDDHQRRRLVQFVREDLRANLMDDRHDRRH